MTQEVMLFIRLPFNLMFLVFML